MIRRIQDLSIRRFNTERHRAHSFFNASRAVAAFALVLCFCTVRSNATGLEPAPVDTAKALEYVPPELTNISVDEHLGTSLPLDLSFTDENGQTVKLQQYFSGKKPVILQLGYFGCPMLCGLVTQGLIDSLKDVSLDTGSDYDVISLSIDPAETASLAKQKKQSYMNAYGRPGTDGGWHFLTGKEYQIREVAKAVGFNYKWVENVQQFSHPAVLMVCNPDGKISRYLYGVRFEPQTVRLSLVEASEGKSGSTADKFILTCFRYDGKQGKYALAAISLMRLGGIITVIALTTVLWRLFRRDTPVPAGSDTGFDVIDKGNDPRA